MIRNSFLAIILLLSIVACNSNAKSARDFSNAMVAKENSLTPEVTACEDNVKKYYEAQQYDSIAGVGKRMEELVQSKIDEIKAIPAPNVKEADKFKTAYIGYFKFIKSLYTNYKEFGMAATDEKRQEILQDIQNTVSRKQDVLNEMRKAQQEFADVNGVKLEKK